MSIIPFPGSYSPQDDELEYIGEVRIRVYQCKVDEEPFLKISSSFDTETTLDVLDISMVFYEDIED